MLVFSMYKISFKYKQMLWGGALLTTFYLACKGKPNLHLDFVGGRRVIFKKFSRDWNQYLYRWQWKSSGCKTIDFINLIFYTLKEIDLYYFKLYLLHNVFQCADKNFLNCHILSVLKQFVNFYDIVNLVFSYFWVQKIMLTFM